MLYYNESNMNKRFRERVKQRRKDLGLTQAQLGTRLGNWKSTISRIESGVIVVIDGQRIEELSDALEVPTEYFFQK